ncbi:hypothetical protein TNCV_563221 [Trichonephila clavipes]|nr:hypothetical protein TNCV_563221 [Trichonephila clavipes]
MRWMARKTIPRDKLQTPRTDSEISCDIESDESFPKHDNDGAYSGREEIRLLSRVTFDKLENNRLVATRGRRMVSFFFALWERKNTTSVPRDGSCSPSGGV